MAWKKQLLEGDLLTVRKNTGADVGTRKRLNFIEGSNITLAITDDAGNEEVDIQITGAAGGGIGTHGNEYHDPNMLPTAGGTHTGTLWMSNGALKDMMYIRSPSSNSLALSYGLASKLTIESDKVQIWDDLISAYDNQDKLGDSTHRWKEFHATDMYVYGTLDFAKHQAKAMALEALGSAPASPATAQMYYNSGDDKVYVYVA